MNVRNIKFRGKSKRTGKWLYGDLVRNVEGAFAVVPPFEMTTDNLFDRYEVDEKTIGQFIGQLDANGKEIYEGDCLKYENIIRIVYYEKEMSQFKMVSPEYLGRPNRICHSCCIDADFIADSYIVIGNIYETVNF